MSGEKGISEGGEKVSHRKEISKNYYIRITNCVITSEEGGKETVK